jgi:hypothetical protein
MKVLREISVKDGLPKTDGIYTVHIHEDPHTSAIYFFTEGNIWGGGVISFGVTSWYEEVDLSDIKDKAYNEGFSTAKKVLEEIQINEAKERYEKAKKKLIELNNKAINYLDKNNDTGQTGDKDTLGSLSFNRGKNIAYNDCAGLLKVAAGLE